MDRKTYIEPWEFSELQKYIKAGHWPPFEQYAARVSRMISASASAHMIERIREERDIAEAACKGFRADKLELEKRLSDQKTDLQANVAVLEAERDQLYEALELFERQWNACGPNSNFGRHFSNTIITARAALAKALPSQDASS